MTLELSDSLFEEVKQRALEAGLSGPEEYLLKQLSTEIGPTDDEIAAKFTPEVIAHLERIAADMDAGNRRSLEEVDARIEQMRQAWRKDRAS